MAYAIPNSLSGYQVPSNLSLAATSSSSLGVLSQAGVRLLHTYGTQNTFLGINSGNFTMTGQRNVALGDGTLAGVTSGTDNCAMGHNALAGITTGTANFGLGQRTLEAATTANRNVGIGNGAMLFNRFSSRNIGIGDAALANINPGGSSDDYNVGLGDSAAATITTGSKNTCVGGLSDVTSGTLTNAGAFGYNARVSVSNALALGGTGAGAVFVGINNASPTERLDISGNIKFNNLRMLGLTSTSADPTTTELPSDKDTSIHKNTTTGFMYLAYNDGGSIKKVALA